MYISYCNICPYDKRQDFIIFSSYLLQVCAGCLENSCSKINCLRSRSPRETVHFLSSTFVPRQLFIMIVFFIAFIHYEGEVRYGSDKNIVSRYRSDIIVQMTRNSALSHLQVCSTLSIFVHKRFFHVFDSLSSQDYEKNNLHILLIIFLTKSIYFFNFSFSKF